MTALSNHKRYYVYALVDPRDGRAFYIGKGTGKRKSRHAAEVRVGTFGCNGAKAERIASIIAAGHSLEERVLHSGLSEGEAFKTERELIHTTPGLTNIKGGVVTSFEAACAKARCALQCFKSYDEWLATTSRHRIDAAAQAFGSPKAAYDQVRGYLLEYAEAA